MAEAETAAPRPWTKRAAMSIPSPEAKPQTSEDAVNSAMPARNRRARPTRSPRRPPSNRKEPKAMR